MEILTTKRLRLRNFRMEESEELYRLYKDADFQRYMHMDSFRKEDIDYLISSSLERTPLDSGSYHYAISHLKSDTLVGEVSLEKKENAFLLGYFVRKEKQGRGYAFEILTALLSKLVFDFPDTDIEAIVDRDNQKSRRLLTKLGFHNDLYQLPDSPYVLYSLYGLIR